MVVIKKSANLAAGSWEVEKYTLCKPEKVIYGRDSLQR